MSQRRTNKSGDIGAVFSEFGFRLARPRRDSAERSEVQATTPTLGQVLVLFACEQFFWAPFRTEFIAIYRNRLGHLISTRLQPGDRAEEKTQPLQRFRESGKPMKRLKCFIVRKSPG